MMPNATERRCSTVVAYPKRLSLNSQLLKNFNIEQPASHYVRPRHPKIKSRKECIIPSVVP